MAQRTSPPPDFDSLYNQLMAAVGAPLEIETSQLGRVMNRSAKDVYQMLEILRMEQARAAGAVPVTGVIVIGHDRGLWPAGGC
jgi:hypothetical protein